MSAVAERRRAIVGLAVPMMCAALAIAGAQLIVMAMLGHLGHQALYIRAAYTPVVFAFLALAEALAASTQVTVALARGRDEDPVPVAAWLLAIGLLASLALAGLCFVLAPELARFVHSPASVTGDLQAFMRWMSLATVPVVITVSIAAGLQGAGRAAAAAAVTFVDIAVEVAVVAVGAFALHLGVFAVAWGSAIGAACSAAVGLAALRRSAKSPHRRSGAGPLAAARQVFTADARVRAANVLRDVGLPIVGSYAALFAFGLLVVHVLRRFGPLEISGFSVGYTVQTMAIVPAIALGSAAAIVANSHLGARRRAQAAAAMRDAAVLAAPLYAALAVAVAAFAFVLPGLIAPNPAVADAARSYLLICGPALLALGLIVVTLTVLEQTGSARLAFALNAANVAAVVAVAAFLASHLDSPDAVYATIAGASIVGLPIVLALGRRRARQVAGDHPAPVKLEPVTAANREAVHELFASRTFLFKTDLPWVAGPGELDALLTADTRAIVQAGAPIGLFELEDTDVAAGHYRLHYRWDARVSLERAATLLEAIVAAERDERSIMRLTYLTAASDVDGRGLAERCALAVDGALPSTLERNGAREGTVYFSRLYPTDQAGAAAATGA